MCTKRWLLGLAMLAGPLAGCDDYGPEAERQVPAPAVTPAPATPAVTPATPPTPPATQASARIAPEPVDTFMSVAFDGIPPQMIAFPPAKLRLRRATAGVTATLYTDDPPAAASKDYKGNSYVFEMDLVDTTGPADLAQAQFRYHVQGSASGETEAGETSNGVFLDGWTTHLQPVEVVVVFEGKAPQLVVKIAGRFRVVSDQKGTFPRTATVQAVLPAMIDGEKAKKK